MKVGKSSLTAGNDSFAQSGKGRKLVMLIEDKEMRKKLKSKKSTSRGNWQGCVRMYILSLGLVTLLSL